MGKWFQSVALHPAGQYTLLLLAGVLFGALSYRSFAERPLWAYFTLLVIGLIPLALFFTNRRIAHLYGLAVIAGLMGGVYLLDAMQESDSEVVLRISQELLRATEQGNYSVFDRYLAPHYRWQNMNKAAMMERVRTALLPSDSRSCSISSAQAKQGANSNEVIVDANLTASGRFGSQEGYFVGTIQLTFQKQPDGKFQVVGTRVASPQMGEVTIPPR